MAEEHPIISDINTHFQEVVLTKKYSQMVTWRDCSCRNQFPSSLRGPSASEGIQVMYYFTKHFYVKTKE